MTEISSLHHFHEISCTNFFCVPNFWTMIYFSWVVKFVSSDFMEISCSMNFFMAIKFLFMGHKMKNLLFMALKN